jgi:hypothetical protein
MDRASQVLAQGVPPGMPRSYRALADHGNVPHSTLHHRARGRPSMEEKARFCVLGSVASYRRARHRRGRYCARHCCARPLQKRIPLDSRAEYRRGSSFYSKVMSCEDTVETYRNHNAKDAVSIEAKSVFSFRLY